MYISFHEDKEKLLRKMAKEYYDGRKGALTAVLEDGLDLLQQKKQEEIKRENAIRRLRAIMDKGLIDLKGKKPYEKRGDLYDR